MEIDEKIDKFSINDLPGTVRTVSHAQRSSQISKSVSAEISLNISALVKNARLSVEVVASVKRKDAMLAHNIATENHLKTMNVNTVGTPAETHSKD